MIGHNNLAIATFLGLCLASTAQAFRCADYGSNLANEGMHKYEILSDCGPPVSKEVVEIRERGGSFGKVEKWLYIIDENGHKQMYLVKFDDQGIVVKTDWLGEQKK